MHVHVDHPQIQMRIDVYNEFNQKHSPGQHLARSQPTHAGAASWVSARNVLPLLPQVRRHRPLPESLPPWHAQGAVPQTRHGGPRVAAEQQGAGYPARRAWPTSKRSKSSSQETKSSSQEAKSTRLLPEIWQGWRGPKARRGRRTWGRKRQTSSYLTSDQHLHMHVEFEHI